MHLVNWEVLKRPILVGGLQIRDPGLANLALSGKLIWQLFVNKNYPISNIFRMKYLKGGSLRNTTFANTPTGIAIQNSCRKGFELFNQQLFRILGNGKMILLWEDKIFENPPLSSVILLTEIMNWETKKGLLWLADIFIQDSSSNWATWSTLDLRACLKPLKNLLLPSLIGLALVHISQKDEWGW